MKTFKEIKKEVQPFKSINGIIGIKLITDETLEQVMKAIEKDIKLYNPYRFLIEDNMIKIALSSNAEPITYYFTEESMPIFEDVLKSLEEICQEKNIIFKLLGK